MVLKKSLIHQKFNKCYSQKFISWWTMSYSMNLTYKMSSVLSDQDSYVGQWTLRLHTEIIFTHCKEHFNFLLSYVFKNIMVSSNIQKEKKRIFFCKISICLNLTLDATDRVGGSAVTLRVVAKLLGFDEGTVFNNDFQGYEVMGNAFSF